MNPLPFLKFKTTREGNKVFIKVIINDGCIDLHDIAITVFREATEYMMNALGSNEKIMKQIVAGEYFWNKYTVLDTSSHLTYWAYIICLLKK